MNQTLTIKQVKKIAQLARIELADGEEQKFTRELTAILGYIDKLNEINTENIEPTSQVANLCNVMREDKVIICKERGEILAQAPETEQDGIKVKAVF